MNGIICIHKPQDFTSFDVIAKLRGITKIRRMGHAGTLDPMATGVLPVFVGYATRACDIMPDASKRYVANFALGKVTDTQDCTGTVLEERHSAVRMEELLAVLDRFRGDIEQIPPMYSAVRIGGQRLYDIARTGREVERPARPVTIHTLNLLSFDEQTQTGTLEVDCSKGTYIRTLVHDIGQTLGVGGMLTALQRTRVGAFTLEDCVTIEQMQALANDGGDFSAVTLPIDRVFKACPQIRLGEAQTRMFINGVRLDLKRVRHQNADGFHTVYGADGAFLGLASLDRERGELKIEKMFCGKA